MIHVHGSESGLLRAAMHRLYEREVGNDVGQRLMLELPPEVMRDYLLEAVLSSRQPVLAAYDVIERAIYNGPEYAGLRGLVRCMDHPSEKWALQQQLGVVPPMSPLVAAFSAIIRRIGYRASHGGLPQAELQAGAQSALRPFLP